MLHLCFEKSIFIVIIDFFNIFILMIDFCCCWYYQLLWGHDKDRPVISDRTHPSGFDRGPDYWSWLLITAPLKPCKLNAAKPGMTVATDPGDPQDCLVVAILMTDACKPTRCMNSCLGCYKDGWCFTFWSHLSAESLCTGLRGRILWKERRVISDERAK